MKLTNAKKLDELMAAIWNCRDRFPMTGKLDEDAAYKNGWYDCAYHLCRIVQDLNAAKI